MKYMQFTHSEALNKEADLTTWLKSNGHVPKSTDKYSNVVKHVSKDLGAIQLLPNFTNLIAQSGIFTQKELANATELTPDWFWHYSDRPIRLRLPTAKLVEQPYDGLFSYLRTVWQALNTIPYPVKTSDSEIIVYLEELTDITFDGQTITSSQLENMQNISVERIA